MSTENSDVRVEMINSLLNVPHREVEKITEFHKKCVTTDPFFYLKLAMKNGTNSQIKDQNRTYMASMMTIGGPSNLDVTRFRRIGHMLTIINITSPKEIDHIVDIAFNHFGGSTGGKKRRIRKMVETYLRVKEHEAETNDYTFFKNAKFLNRLYRKMHIRPGDRAAVSLGLDKDLGGNHTIQPYPSFLKMKEISKITDEEQLCKAITDSNLPGLNLIGAVNLNKMLTPAVTAAIATRLSNKELVNLTNLFTTKGLMADNEFMKYYNMRLTKDKNLGMRSQRAAESTTIKSDKVKREMQKVSDNYIKNLPMLTGTYGILIDKSLSMNTAIALGKELFNIFTNKVENPINNLVTVAFNTSAEEIPVPNDAATYNTVKMMLNHMVPNGATSIGSGFEYIRRVRKTCPEKIILISDGDENRSPYLNDVLSNPYFNGCKVIQCLINVPHTRNIERYLKVTNIDIETIEVDNVIDRMYYSIPEVLSMIRKGGMHEIVKEIDEVNLFTEMTKIEQSYIAKTRNVPNIPRL